MQGRALQPIIEDPDAAWRDVVFYEYWTELVHAIPTMVAVRYGSLQADLVSGNRRHG
jgi:hypothetical protein